MTIVETLLVASWLMLPAYTANGSAAQLGGWGPIDKGLVMQGGSRVLGEGKTYRGLVFGTGCGVAVGIAQMVLRSPLESALLPFMDIKLPAFGYGMWSGLAIILLLSFGALLGDIAASFFKRRFGLASGSPLPVVDQLDFVAGAWLLTAILAPLWFFVQFTPSVMVMVVLITPPLHIGANVLGYLIGKKRVPW
ncbi:MAG: CDP-2,3-bis-(O-geranylgeranyl)-sn-glycerol synthase [Methermicoccaceae archaeon]